ncbi:MAG: hypothetical protein MJE77_08715 [Proteobacteria bacterium]|nr:hypothetical protein [Pseudomonadota bacterium]
MGEQRIAVAILHGVGRQSEDFAEPLIRGLRLRLAHKLQITRNAVDQRFVFAPVPWADVLDDEQEDFWRHIRDNRTLGLPALRRFFIDYVGDAIAYERGTSQSRRQHVHRRLASRLNQIARIAGPSAPLCIVAHSLGCVIASNFLRQCQAGDIDATTPLERGETLVSLFTLGSPLAVFGLGAPEGGQTLAVPAPTLRDHHPSLTASPQWLNLFDAEDVLGWPLGWHGEQPSTITDRVVRTGGPLCTLTPLSHADFFYWTSSSVRNAIAENLVHLWAELQGDHQPAQNAGASSLRKAGTKLHIAAADAWAAVAADIEFIKLVVTSLRRGRGIS